MLKNSANESILKELNKMYRIQLSRGSKVAYVIKKAIASVTKYPLPITSGRQAMELKGVGPALARSIDQVCQRSNTNKGGPKENAQRHNVESETTTATTTKPSYVPGFQTSPWFVLVSFHIRRTLRGGALGQPCPRLAILLLQQTSKKLAQHMKGTNAPTIGKGTFNSLIQRGILEVCGHESSHYKLTTHGTIVVDYAAQIPKASLALANARMCFSSPSSSSSSSSATQRSSDVVDLKVPTLSSSSSSSASSTFPTPIGHNNVDFLSPVAMAAANAARFRPLPGTVAYALLQALTSFGYPISKEDVLKRAKKYNEEISIDSGGGENRCPDGSYALHGWYVMISSRGGLVKRKLVKTKTTRSKGQSCKKYSLTSSGRDLVSQLVSPQCDTNDDLDRADSVHSVDSVHSMQSNNSADPIHSPSHDVFGVSVVSREFGSEEDDESENEGDDDLFQLNEAPPPSHKRKREVVDLSQRSSTQDSTSEDEQSEDDANSSVIIIDEDGEDDEHDKDDKDDEDDEDDKVSKEKSNNSNNEVVSDDSDDSDEEVNAILSQPTGLEHLSKRAKRKAKQQTFQKNLLSPVVSESDSESSNEILDQDMPSSNANVSIVCVGFTSDEEDDDEEEEEEDEEGEDEDDKDDDSDDSDDDDDILLPLSSRVGHLGKERTVLDQGSSIENQSSRSSSSSSSSKNSSRNTSRSTGRSTKIIQSSNISQIASVSSPIDLSIEDVTSSRKRSPLRVESGSSKKRSRTHDSHESHESHESHVPLVVQQSSPISSQSKVKHSIPSATYTKWNDSNGDLGDGQWEVVLLLDNREQRTRNDRTYFRDRLHERSIKCEVRTLPLGDMLWIVRKKQTASNLQQKEWVLHFIIERKRVDDLAGSIIDGRYLEQKFRLQKSALQKVIYLVEGDLAQQDKMSSSHLKTAIIDTEVTQGFYTHQTQHAGDTVEYLSGMHNQIVAAVLVHADQRVGECSRPVMPMSEFALRAAKVSKSSTVQDIFGRMLRQLPRCGASQAQAILNIYPTIGHLVSAYDALGSEAERNALLANIIPKGRSRLGNALSSTAYFFFRGRTYGK